MRTAELQANLSVLHFSEAVFEAGRLGVDGVPAEGLGLYLWRRRLRSLSGKVKVSRMSSREPRGPGDGFRALVSRGPVTHLQHLVDLHTGLGGVSDSDLHHGGR